MNDVVLFVSPSGVALAACALGATRARCAVAWSAAAVLGAVVAALTAGHRDPQVPDGEFVAGLALVSVVMTALPVMAYYALGRALATRRVVLGGIWLVSLIALYVFLVMCMLGVAELVSCPPGAYECPV